MVSYTEMSEEQWALTDRTGYLPAEHIETPTERLARLNKHRNIDVSIGTVTDCAQLTVS